MNIELLLEAERRGILPEDKAALLAEARKRGLVAAAEPESPPTASKSFGQTLRENLLGDNDPNTQNFGEKVGSALNKAGESLSFGLIGDETSAAAESLIPGVEYDDRLDHYRQQEEVLERDNPGLALGADVGGAVAGMALPMGMIGTLGRGAGVLPRVAASAGAGATGAATYGFAEGEGLEDRLDQAQTGAIIGGAVGGAIPAVGAGVQKVADALAARRGLRTAAENAPTTEALRKEGRTAYQQIADAGVEVKPEVVRGKMAEIASVLRDNGLKFNSVGNVMPASRAALGVADEVAASKANSVPFSDLDVARRAMGNAAGSNVANKGDTRAATEALTSLDEFVRNIGADDVNAGDIDALKTILPKARDVWARMSRSQLLDDAMENAADYRTGEASGLRAQFQRIVKNDKLKRGFSDAEIKVMRRVVNGSLPEQLLNYLGSGLGMITQMTAGGIAGGIPGALAGTATAAASRKGSEAIVRKNADIARAIIANGGMTKLPVATDSARKIVESLGRRGAAVVPQ